MLKSLPHTFTNVEAYAPLAAMMRGVLMTSKELGERWRFSDEHLCNLRRAGRGLPFLKLDTGAIRYRQSDIIAAEIAGTCGPLNLDRVLVAVAACPDLSDAHKLAVQAHLRAAFSERKT